MRQRGPALALDEVIPPDSPQQATSPTPFFLAAAPPRRRALTLASLLFSVLAITYYYGHKLYRDGSTQSLSTRNDPHALNDNVRQCRYFLAESAIPRSGLGLFTTINISKGEMAQPTYDLCIYVAETPKHTDFRSHSWSRDTFLGDFEGKKPRAACEGFGTQINSMPPGVQTSKLILDRLPTHGGLTRDKHPGAGAISHHFGLSSLTQRDVAAGSELTIDYGDFVYDPHHQYVAPVRSVEWIRRHGRCVDNIMIRNATDPEMGRGAFASRSMKRGTIVTAAPLQTFSNRTQFSPGGDEPESQFVNYCFQPRETNMMLYPYGIGVNMINHSRQRPNVGLRWADWNMNHHHWLDLPLDAFWEHVYPGAMIVEYVALRDIKKGDELLMDYGPEWDEAWKEHVAHWKPVAGAANHVYPQDMDAKESLRTLDEQKTKPYPNNLGTICYGANEDSERYRGRTTQWKPYKWDWPEGVVWCHILKRYQTKPDGPVLYEAALDFQRLDPFFDPSTPRSELFIVYDIPRTAVSFVEKPYQSDLHLTNAFRHTIALPDFMTPAHWQSASTLQQRFGTDNT